jgi:glycosyltransferase involved in cell wall biosynthesis
MISLNVTVAIPSYNSVPFLIKTVESILAQTRTVNEIIIIHDCSTDNSYEIKLH